MAKGEKQQAVDARKDAAEPLWSGHYKIPWDEPGFSARMLAEHLSQEHDLASRRCDAIDAQVRWIHEQICGGQPRRILDLGCGPGLYLQRLAALGHECCGIDFSPASVAYAREKLAGKAEIKESDLRRADFGRDYDVVMMLYGELNVFSPEECASILCRAFGALVGGGCMVIEPHTFEAVRRIGHSPKSSYRSESGLFSPHPHSCEIDNLWFGQEAAALQLFCVTDAASGQVKTYRSTTKAWTDGEYRKLLEQAGFVNVCIRSDWPSRNTDLVLLTCVKA